MREVLADVKIQQGSYESAKHDVSNILNSRKIYFSQIPEFKADPESHPEVACLFLLSAEIQRLTSDDFELVSSLVDKTVQAYTKSPYLGKLHPRSLAAKAEQCFVRYKMAPTVAKRHLSYLKMRSFVEALTEKG